MRELTLPEDSAGFIRRECPHCRRQFKTRAFPSDGLAVQRYLGERLPHQNDHEARRSVAHRACLYCGKGAAPEAWLTLEQRVFLNRIAGDYARELRDEQASSVAGARSAATPDSDGPLTMLPEPDDLQLVPLLCCGEEAKGTEVWTRALFCPRCGARQQTVPPPRVPLAY